MFIDVTKIYNKSGITTSVMCDFAKLCLGKREKIGINSEYKKKNVTSLSVICDDNKFPFL